MKETTKQYWARVRKIEADLRANHPAGIWLSTLETDNGVKAGALVQALPFVAAQCLANKTHEVATPEQVAAHKERQETEARHIEARRRWAGNMPDVFVVQPGASKR